jgi:hypothetical protein
MYVAEEQPTQGELAALPYLEQLDDSPNPGCISFNATASTFTEAPAEEQPAAQEPLQLADLPDLEEVDCPQWVTIITNRHGHNRADCDGARIMRNLQGRIKRDLHFAAAEEMTDFVMNHLVVPAPGFSFTAACIRTEELNYID